MTKTFAVRGYAQSSLLCCDELYGGSDLESDPDDADLAALAQAWQAGDRRRLVVSRENADAVARGLCTYSNIEDGASEYEGRRPVDRRCHESIHMARSASLALTNLAQAVYRWASLTLPNRRAS